MTDSRIRNFFIYTSGLFKQNQDTPDGNKLKLLWRKIRVWVMLAFGISLLLILISQISFHDFIKSISNVNPLVLIAAILVGLSATILKAARFGFFFPPSGRWLGLYGLFAVLRVLYYLLPFNSGEIVYLSALKKYKFSPSITETAPTWFFLRVTDIIALSFWFLIILFLVPFKGNLFGEMYSFRWIIIGIAVMMLLISFLIPFWVPKIKIEKTESWISKKVALLQAGFRRTFGIRTLTKTLLMSVIIWFSLVLFDTLALLAFNTPLSFIECFLASIGLYCISLLPINAPMNLGTDEAIWTGILMIAGISATQAISIALSIRFVSIILLLLEGLAGIVILSKNKILID